MTMLRKIAKTWLAQYRSRGLRITLLMNIAQLIGMCRAWFFTLLYARLVRASLFVMQSGSTIEMNNKRARLHIGKFVFIRKNVSIRLDRQGQLVIGDKTFINDNCTINCVDRITIGAYTKIAPNVCINDHDHDYKRMSDGHLLTAEVNIGSNVWIGANTVILRGTTIESGAVIAAGSIVKGYVPRAHVFLNKRQEHFIPYTLANPEPGTEAEVAASCKKKVLISVYDLEIGGVERSLINMLESFDYDQYDVDLLICRHTGEWLHLVPEHVHVLPELGPYTVFRKSMKQCFIEGYMRATMIRLIAKLLAGLKARKLRFKEGSGYLQMQLMANYVSRTLPPLQKHYDLAVSYAWPHDLLVHNVQATRKIAWIHTDFSQLEIDHMRDLNVWHHFDYIASISASCTQSFLAMYPTLAGKIIPIENITSPDYIQRMAQVMPVAEQMDATAFKIVSVGRLSYVKGFDLALQALRILHGKGLTNIKWYIVGYGGFEAELTKQIRAYQLEDAFLLLGKKENPYPYMEACDLYVQPSRYEGKAVTVTEAQILRKPVLITNYPTASSQVRDGIDGCICDVSAQGIAAGIESLYYNRALRQSLVDQLHGQDFHNDCELNKLYQIMA